MTKKSINMAGVKTIHFVGVGGCGMSAIAKVLLGMGYAVTGSDLKESVNTMRLRDLGAKIYVGHKRGNIRSADIIITSTAIPRDNVEKTEAELNKIREYQRADMLSWVMDQFKQRIAVSGTHGKTTTSSMIASIFLHAGFDPTFLIGGDVNNIDGNARFGGGNIVVAEADESDKSFLKIHPTIEVVTNIEVDHIENYGNYENIVKAFSSFIDLLPKDGVLVINNDKDNIRKLLEGVVDKKVITYGLTDKSDYYVSNFKFSERRTKFDVFHKGKKLGEVTLCVPGRQNILNALAGLIVGLEVGCDFSQAGLGLQIFSGAKRRFQVISEVDDVMVVDDYGHHPTEIKATLQAARSGYGDERRIISIFQPHRYTRTLHLYKEFGESFSDSNVVIVTDIYGAGEDPIAGVSGKMVADEVSKNGKEVIYIAGKEKVPEHIMKMVRPKDIIMTIGAGDIFITAKEISNRLKMKSSG
ncbi:UDP-N-acetylmuramate--L-alanine ligase [Candidatus Margulisiibacteriota bacterium]